MTIQKSPTAADEEGGIAGSVMISMARPFDYAESRFIASAEAAHNSIFDEVDPRVSFLASTPGKARRAALLKPSGSSLALRGFKHFA